MSMELRDGNCHKMSQRVMTCRKLSSRLSPVVVTFFSRPLPTVPFWFSPSYIHFGFSLCWAMPPVLGRRERTPTPKTRFSIWTLLRTPGRFTTRPLPVHFTTKSLWPTSRAKSSRTFLVNFYRDFRQIGQVCELCSGARV